MTWSEAFTIFMLILTFYFPPRWKDLTSYKLFILRTYRQFSGRVWLAYDQAFRQHAGVTKLIDWSTMNVQLYNFHPAGTSVCSGSGGSLSELPEPSGADSSLVICRVVEQEPLFGTICFMSVRLSLQHLCGFQPCVGMLPLF